MPRTACWAAIIAGAFNLRDRRCSAPISRSGCPAGHPPMPWDPSCRSESTLQRAAEFFLWLGGHGGARLAHRLRRRRSAFSSLFYMGIGFREPVMESRRFSAWP